MGDAELAKAYEALLAVGYGAGAAQGRWDSATLLAAVARARKHMTIHARNPVSGGLPPLNPTAF